MTAQVSGPLTFPDPFPVLVSPNLVLRETDERDLEAIFAMESDPVAMRYWSRPPMRELDEAREALERVKRFTVAREALRWSITRPAEDRMLGHVSMFSFSWSNRRAEIGYGLARPHWGQGIMHEALTAVIDWAFGPLGLNRLEADTDPRNHASLRALDRLGFTREGLLRERWQVGGEISDSAVLGLLARDWHAHRSARA